MSGCDVLNVPACGSTRRSRSGAAVQGWRLASRVAFFALFVLAPALDIFRLDLVAGHFVVLGHDWRLGLDGLSSGAISPAQAVARVVLRAFVPIAAVVGLLGWASWRFGRVYCGWLCPHFSVVETINGLWRRAWRRPGFWERAALPHRRADGRALASGWWWRAATVVAVVGFAFLWAVTLLTYLLPPAEVWGNLVALTPTRNQALFIGVATAVLAGEFAFARHLFCRFGCALGVFQSFVWIANRNAMVVGFDRARARACADCFKACEHACPMRLKPRAVKRLTFACTQCARCIEACDTVQAVASGGPSLLEWVRAEAARAETTPFGGPERAADRRRRGG
ncbi:MAG: 4Fe-4S binding protein [Ectothiorhodospiraceae bacterium]|nr:4Fe-4S binding protein [Chromatiales bacterium]MCP5154104.1 4Fe-4S binding protein [Ectothiorhodospiraceae bacterium]